VNEVVSAKGGRARASVLTPEERSEIARKAVQARWAKAGKGKKETPVTAEPDDAEADESEHDGIPDQPDMPFSLFEGILEVGDKKLPCHVLNNGMRVLTHRGMVRSLGMARGGSSKGGGDRLAHFVNQERLKPYMPDELLKVTAQPPMRFRAPNGQRAYGRSRCEKKHSVPCPPPVPAYSSIFIVIAPYPSKFMVLNFLARCIRIESRISSASLKHNANQKDDTGVAHAESFRLRCHAA
jgi:hypothetical protein